MGLIRPAGVIGFCAVAVAAAAAVLLLDPHHEEGANSLDGDRLLAFLEEGEPGTMDRFQFVREGGWTEVALREGSDDLTGLNMVDPPDATVRLGAPEELQSEPAPKMASLGPARTDAPAPWTIESRRAPAPQAAEAPQRHVTAPIHLPWLSRAPATQPRPARHYTLRQRLDELSPAATLRLAAKFEAAKAQWPPAEIALLAIKDEKRLELFARPAGGTWKLVHRYPVLAASGGAGPKLRQGDKQVPEGVYGISFLNPNSQYHVSLRVNYPNAFDKRMAAADGRKEPLGGDIMIHGKNLSVGCLAVGDEAAEELFVLAAQTGLPNIKLVIAPTDFRRHGVSAPQAGQPAWLPKLYTEVSTAMAELKSPPPTGLMSLFGGWGK